MLWLWFVYYVLLSLSGYFKLEWQSILLLLGWYVFLGGSCKREKRMASKGRSGEKEKGQLFWFGKPGGKKGASPFNFETQFYQNACSLCLVLLHFQISLFRLEIEVY